MSDGMTVIARWQTTTAYECPECLGLHDTADAECHLECNAEMREVSVVAEHRLTGAVQAARVVLDAAEPCAVGNRHVKIEHLNALAKACGLPPLGGQ